MKRPRHIERDGFHVFDWPAHGGFRLTDLWVVFPELVIGHYLVNTSYDSGFVTLSDSQRQDGWHMVGKFAHSPQIGSTDQIPHDQFDEWLVFEQPVEVNEFETMVNFCGFTPIDFDWEEKRERFWEQVLRLRPLNVVAENYGCYLLSRDDAVVRKILDAEPGAAPNAASPHR
jgi:hypothetical protein